MAKIEFRKAALERLNSPEQLDQPLVLISGRIWIVLLVSLILTAAAIFWSFWAHLPVRVEGYGIFLVKGELTKVIAPQEGALMKLFVTNQDQIKKGQHLASVENSDRVLEIYSPIDGEVMEIVRYPISYMHAGDAILIISPSGDFRKDLIAHTFVPAEYGKRIHTGMPATIEVAGFNKDRYGFVRAKVGFVGSLPTSSDAMQAYFKIPEIGEILRKSLQSAPFYIELLPVLNARNPSGYDWTSMDPSDVIEPGTFFKAYVTIDENRPIDYVLPVFERIIWKPH